MITEEGTDITLTCLTTGPPSPSITWYKGGSQNLGQGQLINGTNFINPNFCPLISCILLESSWKNEFKDEKIPTECRLKLADYKSLLVMSSVDLTTTGDYKCVSDYGDLGTHESETASVIIRGILIFSG